MERFNERRPYVPPKVVAVRGFAAAMLAASSESLGVSASGQEVGGEFSVGGSGFYHEWE